MSQWQTSYETPKEYKDNKLVQQLGAGTNSDAIADVITQQFSEKWLNIIVMVIYSSTKPY